MRSLPGLPIQPGVYPELPINDYHASAAISASGLKHVARSVEHYLHYRQHGTASAAMSLGRAVHSICLEGQLSPEFARSEFDNMRTNKAKAWRDEQIAAGRTILRPEECDDLDGCAQAVLENPFAGEMIAQGQVECSYVWDDEIGPRCRVRPDIYIPTDGGVLVDLKTTRDASPRAFQRSMVNFGYHRQLALYRRGLLVHGLEVRSVVVIAAETAAPYGVAVYHLDSAWVGRGDQLVDDTLRKLADWMQDETEPGGYPETIQYLTMPSWA